MPQVYLDKLKAKSVHIGHERCASSNFADAKTLIVCAIHLHREAVSVLYNGVMYSACPLCIQEFCSIVEAKTEEKPRGYFESR